MAKSYLSKSTLELVELGNEKAVAELQRRVAKTGSAHAQKALIKLGVGVDGGVTTEDASPGVPPNRVAMEQAVDSGDATVMLQMMKQLASMMGVEFPMPEPKPAAKTRKVKTVNVPPASEEPTLMAMSRDQLKQLAGVAANSRLRTPTLVETILANQKPQTKPRHTNGEYLTGIKGTKTLTDDGVILTILGASQKDDDGEWLDEAAPHPTSGTVGRGETAKEAMHALNDALAEQGYRIGWKSNYFQKVEGRNADHLLRSKQKSRKRNINKSSVLTADVH